MSEYDYTQIQTTGKFMALSCTHGNLVDPKALTKFIRAKAKYKPKHMLHLGDCFEFTALRKGASEDEKRLDIEEDIEAGLNTLKRVFNGITGERWCLRGNHCQRLWDMADKGSVISQDFAKVHIKRIEDFFAEHKIKTKPYCSTQGVIQINDLLAMHGYGFGVNAAKDHLKIYHNHVIFGHTHRAEEAVGTGWPKPIVAINCGMMMQKFPKYASRTTSVLSWTHAFVKGEFLKDGTHTKKLVTL